ncbi:MAG TPA: sugar-binding protein, partial [Gemmatimonadaceae bacterium]
MSAQTPASQAAPAGRETAAPPSPARTAATTATAARAKSPPVIDGSDADAAWADAAPITDFRTFQPVDDGEPRYKTEARVLNDESNIYVLVRAFDPHPDSI